MSRRRLWGSLSLVLSVLVVASWGGRRGAPDWGKLFAEGRAAIDRLPMSWLGVIAGVGLAAAMGWAVARLRRRGTPVGEDAAFAAELTTAMTAGARVVQVRTLHASGRSLGDIARETRLSRDAVRGVLGGT